jgi:hypothetical protein
MNNMPKHDGQATVASFDSQYRHCGASDEIAAPQFGQLRVCASMIMAHIPRRPARVYGAFCPQELYHPAGLIFYRKMLDELIMAVRCSRFTFVRPFRFLCDFASSRKHFFRKR